MATPASGDSPYCSVAQFLRRHDSRSVRELLSDTGSPVAAGDVASDPSLADLLAEASGLVEAAACAGQAYVIDPTQTPPRNDLAALTGNSAAFLAGTVAHVAMYLLWSRRPALMAPSEAPPLCKMALDHLERLRLGERVFGILENHRSAHARADRETAAQVEDRQGVVFNAERFFGTRVNRSGP